MGEVKFETADINPQAEKIFRKVLNGTLKATSVGFLETGEGKWVETKDAKGNVVFQANGVIHEFKPNQKITRTFEMENAPFGVQLEFLEFEKLTDETSLLSIHTVFRSNALRDQLLQLPFAQGINMAHNRLQEIVSKLM